MNISYNKQSIFVSSGGVQWQSGLPTLLMQHGAGLDRTVWVLLARYFARHGFNVVALDLPGHGASDGQPFSSIEQNAQWLNDFVAHLTSTTELAADKLIYCGHSMGSLVVLEAAAMQIEKMDKLLLLGSAVPMVVGDPLLNAARENDHAAIDMINMFGHSYGSRIGNNKISGINVYNTMEVLLERAEPGVLYADLNACNEYKNGELAASALAGKVNATVISGDADRMTPTKLGKKLANTLGGTFSLLPDCGHMMMSEKPEDTLQAMKRALSVSV